MIQAKVIEHSYYPLCGELITLEVILPYFLDAEFEKHRMFSSNSSSARAIPISKTIKAPCYIPNDVRINQKGMQGYARLPYKSTMMWQLQVKLLHRITGLFIKFWDWKYNIHKQHLNRYLSPFRMQRKIVTANREWFKYFLGLRLQKDVDPNMQSVAIHMDKALSSSNAKILKDGEWHLPYLNFVEKQNKNAKRLSAARCARVSYNSHEGTYPTHAKDLTLAEDLETSRHLTPFEHQGIPVPLRHNTTAGITHFLAYDRTPCSGNFKNWIQYRQLL